METFWDIFWDTFITIIIIVVVAADIHNPDCGEGKEALVDKLLAFLLYSSTSHLVALNILPVNHTLKENL